MREFELATSFLQRAISHIERAEQEKDEELRECELKYAKAYVENALEELRRIRIYRNAVEVEKVYRAKKFLKEALFFLGGSGSYGEAGNKD